VVLSEHRGQAARDRDVPLRRLRLRLDKLPAAGKLAADAEEVLAGIEESVRLPSFGGT
jgi:hypothetical protein